MPVVLQKVIRRADLRANPHTLYAFGDNLEARGKGGQAREMRGEPNAVGIPTKRAPSMREGAFLVDADLERVRAVADKAFARLVRHLEAGGTVCLPADGIGTGLAQLQQRAPAVWAYVNGRIEALKRLEGGT